MFSFGSPIKHKVRFVRNDGTEASATLTCVNVHDAEDILKEQKELDFKEIIYCEKFEDCDDCKLN